MSKQVQLRRGTAAQNDAFTGAPAEVTVDMTTNDLRLHDGDTPGGHPLSRFGIPAGGTTSQVLAKGSDADRHAVWIDPPASDIPGMTPETVTATAYTPVLDDANTKLKRLSDPTGVTLTIPAADDVAFAIGDTLTFEQAGAGAITIVGGIGVNVRRQEAVNAVSAGQYSIFQAIKISSTQWVLLGSLESSQVGYLPGSTQTFTASGTWTKPAGCRSVEVEVVGGGAGGGGVSGATSQCAAGGGGGAGGYARRLITTALGATELVTIGAGGAGGSAGANSGTAGGTSSFGSHASAAGGSPGNGMAAGTSVTTAAAGSGGNGSGGDVNAEAGIGNRGLRWSGTIAMAGNGGNGRYGNGGQTNVNNTGADGSGYGGGGAGAATTVATDRVGGSGRSGIVIIKEYY